MDSPIADIANMGDRYGGMLVAGLFLKEFVKDGQRWAHLDIAGPSCNAGAAYGYTPKGGTGHAVRTLVRLAEDLAARSGLSRAAAQASGRAALAGVPVPHPLRVADHRRRRRTGCPSLLASSWAARGVGDPAAGPLAGVGHEHHRGRRHRGRAARRTPRRRCGRARRWSGDVTSALSARRTCPGRSRRRNSRTGCPPRPRGSRPGRPGLVCHGNGRAPESVPVGITAPCAGGSER